jgi:hypothetical protein
MAGSSPAMTERGGAAHDGAGVGRLALWRDLTLDGAGNERGAYNGRHAGAG